MEFLLICDVTMEMALDYDGARFLGCFMLYFYFFMEHGCSWRIRWSLTTKIEE
jgi:hypothetical protein